MVCEDQAITAIFTVYSLSDEGRFLQTILCGNDRENFAKFIQAIGNIPRVFAQPSAGTALEGREIKKLEKALSKLSPNGKKLQDVDVVRVMPKIWDTLTRQHVSVFLSTFGSTLIPLFIVEKTLGSDKKKSPSLTATFLYQLLNDRDLVTRKYEIGCISCEQHADILVFTTNESAQSALRSSEAQKCSHCRGQLAIVECFELTSAARDAVGQGLWLEFLIYDAIRETASVVFAGRMIDMHELDVVAVLGEQTVLFECKDGPIGHNDILVLAAKAEVITADEVVCITTQPIHDNVKQVAEQARPRGPGFSLLEVDEPDAIREQVNTFVQRLQQQYFDLGEFPLPDRLFTARLPRAYLRRLRRLR